MGQKQSIKKVSKAVKDGAIILDVRTHMEFVQGHLCGAIHVPTPLPPLNSTQMKIFRRRLYDIHHQHPNTIIVVYCKKGIRSGIASNILQKLGNKVINFGGILERPLNKIITGEVKDKYLRVCYD